MGVRTVSPGFFLRVGVLAIVLCEGVGYATAAEVAPPAASEPAAIAAGAALFARMNCDGCHGIGALGWVGPSLVDGRWRFGGDAAAIFRSISEGRPQGMPAYGGVIAEAGIREIVSYLLSLPPPKDVSTLHWSSKR